MKTSKRDFEAFKTEFRKYQRLFGLTDYKLVFYQESVKDGYAEICIGDHIVRVSMTDQLETDHLPGFDARASGRHEALHLLTWRLYALAGQRCVVAREIEEEWEALVRRIEYALEHGRATGDF